MNGAERLRWLRFVDETTACALIVPVDHGLTIGPQRGIESSRRMASWLRHPSITGVIAHKGVVRTLSEVAPDVLSHKGVMVHLNGSTAIGEDPDQKVMLTSVAAAARLGADAVSLQVSFTADNHAHNVQMLGTVVDQAADYGLPVLAMVYPKSQYGSAENQLRYHRHLLRVAYELGVHAIKTSPPSDLATLPLLIDGIGHEVPVLFSGGSLASVAEVVSLAAAVKEARAAGLCIGRNVFGADDPGVVVDSIVRSLREPSWDRVLEGVGGL